MFQLCYGLVDIHIIGSVLGDNSLAAVGATAALSDLLIEFINGIICGFGIIMSVCFGKKDEHSLRKAIGGSLILGIGITLVLSVACLVFLPGILGLLNVSEELFEEASVYIGIIIAGLAVTTVYNLCSAILRAIGDSFTPLLILILSNIINIALDYLCIKGLGMGVAGAALATIAAQAVSVIFCLLYMYRKCPNLILRKSDLVPDQSIYKKLLKNGFSMGFMISFVTFGSLALQTGINTLGNSIIVGHTGARKATLFFLIPFFSLGTALATYCGQNLGAKQFSRIKKGIVDAILIAGGWCAVVIVIVFTLAPLLVSTITASTDPEVINNAVKYLRINSLFYILPAVICILRNSMQGFGDTRTPLFSSFIELTGKVLIAFLLIPRIGYLGVIVSEPIVWTIMVIPLIYSVLRNPELRLPEDKVIDEVNECLRE